MAPFRHMLHDHRLWSVRRRTIVPAFAIGIFVGFMPFPGHMLIAALLALALHINIPVAVVTTLFSNPLTMPPLYYGCFRFGQFLLEQQPRPFTFELSFAWLATQFGAIWQPLLLGCVLLGAAGALIGYAVLDILWRVSIADYLEKRRAKRRRKATEA